MNEDCPHTKTDISYGYFPAFGVKGIGVGTHCVVCYTLLAYHPDYEVSTEEELEWYKSSKWCEDE